MDLSNNSGINSIANSNKLILDNVKVKNIGNSSLELSDNELKIKSFGSNYVVNKSLNDLDFMIYSKGNFLFEDKIFLGISNEQFEISCSDNEVAFKNFYDKIKNMKKTAKANNNNLGNNVLQDTVTEISNETESTENIESDSVINVSEEIRNFHNLMKEGIISEEEFENKKKELLKL